MAYGVRVQQKRDLSRPSSTGGLQSPESEGYPAVRGPDVHLNIFGSNIISLRGWSP